jgi:hypothetical protein
VKKMKKIAFAVFLACKSGMLMAQNRPLRVDLVLDTNTGAINLEKTLQIGYYKIALLAMA